LPFLTGTFSNLEVLTGICFNWTFIVSEWQ